MEKPKIPPAVVNCRCFFPQNQKTPPSYSLITLPHHYHTSKNPHFKNLVLKSWFHIIADGLVGRHNKPIRLGEIHPHWHKLYMSKEESNGDLFSVAEEWSGIQERLESVPYQMKLEIKVGLRLLAFLETTMLSPPPRNLPTKGANKKNQIYTKNDM